MPTATHQVVTNIEDVQVTEDMPDGWTAGLRAARRVASVRRGSFQLAVDCTATGIRSGARSGLLVGQVWTMAA